MKLPLELRDKVYSYGLMVEGHITPYPEYYHYRRNLDCKGDKLRSFIGILSLSKAVHEEAAVIFYGKNTFRVSSMAKELALDYMMHDATGPEKVSHDFKLQKKQSTDMLFSVNQGNTP